MFATNIGTRNMQFKLDFNRGHDGQWQQNDRQKKAKNHYSLKTGKTPYNSRGSEQFCNDRTRQKNAFKRVKIKNSKIPYT